MQLDFSTHLKRILPASAKAQMIMEMFEYMDYDIVDLLIIDVADCVQLLQPVPRRTHYLEAASCICLIHTGVASVWQAPSTFVRQLT